MLYKYLSLSNMKRVEDILKRKRMYAAKFNELNDPMEGLYLYNLHQLNQHHLHELYNGKLKYGILSLSNSCDNMLLWSHYADAHSGIVIGVSIEEQKYQVEPVDYVKYDDLTADFNDHDLVSKLLTRKLELWKYEEEQRVLVPKRSFVSVKVQRLILGIKSSEWDRERIGELKNKYCPNVEFEMMTREKLNVGRWHISGFGL